MEVLWHELTYGLPDREHLETVILRVITAIVLGGIVGIIASGPASLRACERTCS